MKRCQIDAEAAQANAVNALIVQLQKKIKDLEEWASLREEQCQQARDEAEQDARADTRRSVTDANTIRGLQEELNVLRKFYAERCSNYEDEIQCKKEIIAETPQKKGSRRLRKCSKR